MWSLSSRRAWIEIHLKSTHYLDFLRRSPRGERGLKYLTYLAKNHQKLSRSPRGERGLK